MRSSSQNPQRPFFHLLGLCGGLVDTIGQIPIRIGIPVVLTAPEAKAALEEFVGFLAELAAVPDADKMTFGEAYKGVCH
jgi:hypothetical protein